MGADNDNSELLLEQTPEHKLAIVRDSACEAMRFQVKPDKSLIKQGLDSLGAVELMESLRRSGYEIDYSRILRGASLRDLASTLVRSANPGPRKSSEESLQQAIPLSGPQQIWADLEHLGWGSWANISLCISIPASAIPAALLPAMVQVLCDTNDALRMILVEAPSADATPFQQIVPDFQVQVQMDAAPKREAEVMRRLEAFEGEKHSPYGSTTRALVLAAADSNARHWLCVSLHHAFLDREAIHVLIRQLREMVSTRQLRIAPPPFGFADYVQWQREGLSEAKLQNSRATLKSLLSRTDVSSKRAMLRLAEVEEADLGDLPTSSTLQASVAAGLGEVAVRLGTTVPLLLHGLFQALVARLTGDHGGLSGESDVLTCHVVSNRERFSSLRDLAGCLDTSIPVAIQLGEGMTLKKLCASVQTAFAKAFTSASNLPRGDWMDQDDNRSGDNGIANLFERVAHVNIIRNPPEDAADDGIEVHRIRRVQQTRWGLLLRAFLPTGVATPEPSVSGTAADSGIRLQLFADHRPLAISAHYCLVELIRALQREPIDTIGEVDILELLERIVAQATRAARQVRHAAALVPRSSSGEPFIWNKLIERQRRWYEHDQSLNLRRDACNRFIGTSANPFPFTQLDKLAEREFLQELDVPTPKLLHVLPRENLADELSGLAPELPPSFVIKPVGAGHSLGVTAVWKGTDLTRGIPFDPKIVAAELEQMAARGYCVHEGKRFPFNFTSFLIEEHVVDELGFQAPTDYKVFVIGPEFLWAQVLFRSDNQAWAAFVDEDFKLLPQPAWDPTTCWRTHRALVCTEQAMADSHKPECWSRIVKNASRLGESMNIFVRLDWYADVSRGPLLGEITTFPHMLQPRLFYSAWANKVVGAAWQDPDGVVPEFEPSIENDAVDLRRIDSLLQEPDASLLTFFPEQTGLPWATPQGITFGTLSEHVDRFDLAAWGVKRGDRVALLVANGMELGGVLIATMHRYLAIPLAPALPVDAIVREVRECSATAIVVIEGTAEAQHAREASQRVQGLKVIGLTPIDGQGLPTLPPPPDSKVPADRTPPLGLHDRVLMLSTSGTTGEPKPVSFTLSRLIRAGSLIGQSLQLSPTDGGISMLPLHRVGGISCNLVAPLVCGSSMHFYRNFDPKAFFDSLEDGPGATWCYLVPSLWKSLMEYAGAHPALRADKPWPRLRAVRSAGADLPHDLATKLKEFFGGTVRVLPTYGMTEAMPIASPPVDYQLERPGSVGPTLPGVSIEIVGYSDGGECQRLPDGVVGEVTVSGPMVVPHDDGTKNGSSNEFTPRGYFRTGDLGRLDANGSGWLYVTDRLKDVINRGGETISPARIETVLREYPGFKDSEIMVFARAHAQLQESVALAVAPQSTQVQLSELRSWADKRLPPSMLPQTLVAIPALPVSDVGKLLRTSFAKRTNTLLSPCNLTEVQEFSMDADSSVHPQGELERPQVASAMALSLEWVLSEVRGFLRAPEVIDPDTRFDEAGLNSLAAVEFSSRLSSRFGVELPAWVISDYPTPRSLYSHLCSKFSPTAGANTVSAISNRSPPVDTPGPSENSARTLTVLMLHGEGADSTLMNLSMQAAQWVHGMSGSLEFKYMDAPHRCAPKPEFHPRAVEIGLYNKSEYRSWCVTDRKTLEESIASVSAKIDELGSVDAIGGICDGGLVAALIASQRPDLRLYFNFASSPFDRLPEDLRQLPRAIDCASVHLISPQDEMLSMEELLDIPGRCERALVLQHDGGHAVPTLSAGMKRDIHSLLAEGGGVPIPSLSRDDRLPDDSKSAAEPAARKLTGFWRKLFG